MLVVERLASWPRLFLFLRSSQTQVNTSVENSSVLIISAFNASRIRKLKRRLEYAMSRQTILRAICVTSCGEKYFDVKWCFVKMNTSTASA